MLNRIVRPSLSVFEAFGLSVISAAIWSNDWGWWEALAIFPVVGILLINEGLYKSKLGGGDNARQ